MSRGLAVGLAAGVLAVAVEVAVVVLVALAIGPWWTIGLLLAGTCAGAVVLRRVVRRAGAVLASAASGVAAARRADPGVSVSGAVLTAVGGGLLLLPGFVSDAVGIALLLPPLRRPVGRLAGTLGRRATGAMLSARAARIGSASGLGDLLLGGTMAGRTPREPAGPGTASGSAPRVVPGDVVDPAGPDERADAARRDDDSDDRGRRR